MLFETVLILSVAFLGFLYFLAKNNKRERIDLLGKHVVITGGSSGIGYDLSLEAVKQGAHVTVIARNKDKLNKIKAVLEEIRQKSGTINSQIIQVESLDISKSFEETKAAFERLSKTAGPVDILINNAGISRCGQFSELTIQDFEDLMRVNYLGGVYCTKSVVESMKNRRFGRILFVSSQAGQIGIFGYSAYSASKFALRGLVEALQMEVKPYNIFVTLSFPPDTDTPGFKEENITKCEENRLISESSGLSSSKEVAQGIIRSIKKGKFVNYFGLNGFLLCILTAGAAPITSLKDALLEIIMMPLARIIALGLLFNFDTIVKKCHKNKLKAK
ncbi:3-ketodihydrosphingosine reductase [Brachionus plicatilis]|uniref:3-dehydrosphinganine reductase n=1 Tax=Brachionus plicatilis TaxID=10195 RepID=A0A3M7Q3Y5_BRAPC|nr:3-ketodihydrosphingosine reductase [Brachionus plicatilis]